MNTLDNRMLPEIPLLERSILANDCELLVVYEITGDLDFDITLSKKYSSNEKLETALMSFLSAEKKHQQQPLIWHDSFPVQQKKAKKELFSRLVTGRLLLPDNGEGFNFVADMDYMKTWIDNL